MPKSKKTILSVEAVPIISISGKKAFGKDFWGTKISQKYKNTKLIAFADSLRLEIEFLLEHLHKNSEISFIANKLQASELDVLAFKELYDASPEKWPQLTPFSRTHTMLKMLQLWGTNVRRGANPDYWVNKLKEEAYKLNQKGIVPIVTDARFPNEVELIHELGGLAINISISQQEQIRRLKARDGFVPDITQLSHVSESGLDNYNNFQLTLLTEFTSDEVTMGIIAEKINELHKN